MLGNTDVKSIKTYLLSLADPKIEELSKILKAVLQDVKFVTVTISDFKPSHTTLWGSDELDNIVQEFKTFLIRSAKQGIVKIE